MSIARVGLCALLVLVSACMTPLMKAAADPVRTRELLDRGAEVNERMAVGGWTALHVAAQYGSPEVVRLLIERGADIYAISDGGTPLAVALANHREENAQVIRQEITRRSSKTAAEETSGAPPSVVALHASVLVMDLKATGAVAPQFASFVTKTLLARLDDVPGLRTVTPADLQLMLSIEKQKDALGCDDVRCMAEMGGALGTDFVIYGAIGDVGKQYSLDLTAIDARRSLAVGRISTLVMANEDALAASISTAVVALIGKIERNSASAPSR